MKDKERLGVDGFTWTTDPRWQAQVRCRGPRWGLLILAVVGLSLLCAAAAGGLSLAIAAAIDAVMR
jgi:hypothetical protein